MEEEALIKNNNTCKDFLIEALKYHLLPADQRHLIKTDRTRPRTPISIPKVPKRAAAHRRTTLLRVYFVTGDCARVQVMIVVGGQAPKAIRSVECYDFQEDRWYQVADLPSRRCRAGRASAPLIRSGGDSLRLTVFTLVSRRGLGGGPRVRRRGLQQLSARAHGRHV